MAKMLLVHSWMEVETITGRLQSLGGPHSGEIIECIGAAGRLTQNLSMLLHDQLQEEKERQ